MESRWAAAYREQPRSRRAFLRTSVVGGFAALVAAACGKGGSKVDTAASTTTTAAKTATAAPISTAAPITTAAPTTAAASTATTAPPATVGASNGSVTALAKGQELRVSFVYTAGADSGPGGPGGPGGRGPGGVKNPYVAVWVESAEAKAVRTMLLTMQPGKSKYLPELRRWYRDETARQAAGGADLVSTVSSATRVPGSYDVVWDGAADDGSAVAAGTYYLCIEAAREHGPYSIVREALTFDGKTFEKALTANGELSNVVARLVAR